MMQYYQHFPVIAIIVLFLGAFMTVLFGTKSSIARKIITLISTGTALILMILLIKPIMIDKNVICYWMGNWVPVNNWAIGIGLEIDQLSLFFGLLVTLTVFLSGIYSFKYMSKDDMLEKYYVLFLMLSGSVLGLVLTGDLFNMFVMIEIMTFAAVALTAFRNNSEGALEAAFKYIVVGTIGSSMVLIGTIILYAQFHTLNIAQLASMMHQSYNPIVVWLAFGFLMGGYAIKSFIVPSHFTAADAYTAAPASISMVFSGMVNKAGVYAMIRLLYTIYQCMDMKPFNILVVTIGTITMFVGVTMALTQHDLKRLLAFHSISQIGYVITAIGIATPLGVTAGLYHAMNHTLFKGLLFLCAGAIFYATGTTDLNKLGGLAKKMPQTTIIFLIAAFSISGLPPFNGFVSKWLIYQATYESNYAPVTIVALIVSVMTLASFVKVIQSVFFGQLSEEHKNVKEVPLSMRIPMWILASLCIIAGIVPQIVNKYIVSPAVGAVFNVQRYAGLMMGKNYAEDMFGKPNVSVDITYKLAGYWNPVSWLILFVILLAGFSAVILIGGFKGKQFSNDQNQDSKYENFYCGEKYQYTQIGGNDLFWGFKFNLRHYFSIMHDWHSGIVNDYALYAVFGVAFFIVYAFIFAR